MPNIELEKKQNKKWEKDWKEFWKPLLITDDKLDEQKIKNEMHDLVFCYEQVSEVYMHITGGMLSKPNYYANVITSKYDEMHQQAYDEGYSDCKDDFNIKKD